MPLVAATLLALGVGGVLFISAFIRIFKHDDPSNGIMVRCASGFVLLIAVLITGAFQL
jgi:hypothetical protein